MEEYKVIFEDMKTYTANYATFSDKIHKYLDLVEPYINKDLYGFLSSTYDLSLLTFQDMFFDFDSKTFRQEEFDKFCDSFCYRIDTIIAMTDELDAEKVNEVASVN